MKILFCQWGSICESGINNAFTALGYTVICFTEKFTNKDLDINYINKLADIIMSTPSIDYVFSINFIPIIAKTCNAAKTHYISWTVDSPSLTLHSKSMSGPYSHAFIFDYALYNKYKSYFPDNVYYMPLGCDRIFYDQIMVSEEDQSNYNCDVSFVGSFHTDYCEYDRIKDNIPERMQGYIDGLINAQLNIYGYNLIEDSISDAWAREFTSYANWTTIPDYEEDIRGIVADHYIGFKCTQLDRIRTLQSISNYYNINLYTTEDTSMLPDVNNLGIADSVTMMPRIFKCSKINLNMTARTIRTGIPQRVFDIMAAGGFVISNYQSEIPEYFSPDEDIVLYDSIPDLTNKIDYYLKHDKERRQIALNGYNKVINNYTYENKIIQMLDMLN